MEQFGPGLAVLLGFLEGLTEFLPVSSTGHLILLGHYLGFTGDMAISVEICIQIGAVLAVAAYEREKILGLLYHGPRIHIISAIPQGTPIGYDDGPTQSMSLEELHP